MAWEARIIVTCVPWEAVMPGSLPGASCMEEAPAQGFPPDSCCAWGRSKEGRRAEMSAAKKK